MVAAAALAVLLPSFAAAQGADPAGEARFRLGPLALDPRLAVSNVGMDTNVFNDADNPERDFTATVGPELVAWLRMGRLQLTNTSGVGWNYFSKRAEQRSFDYSEEVRADLVLVSVTPHAQAALERTRQRPNLEIDARVRRRTERLGAGLLLALGSRWSIDLEHEQSVLDFADGEFGDPVLAEALNRTERDSRVTTRFVLTPLTTFVVRAANKEDRFEHSPLRNADSRSVMPGLEFKPLALISGTAFVGYRSFSPTNAEVREFRGAIASVDLTYTLRDLTRLTGVVERDIEYSFDLLRPYYVSTGLNLEVTQSIGRSWDIGASGSRTSLSYRALTGAEAAAGDGDDVIGSLGVSGGRRLGADLRVGIDVRRVRRRSPREDRNYSGWKVGGSFSYGY